MTKPSVYVVQAWCTGLGWVDSKYASGRYMVAVQKAHQLVSDDSAWLSGRRLVRIAQRRFDDPQLPTVPPLACYYPPGISRGDWGNVPGADTARRIESEHKGRKV